MPVYDLYNTDTGELIRSQDMPVEPVNPAGKPWAWQLQDRPGRPVGGLVEWSPVARDWVTTPLVGGQLDVDWADAGAAARRRIEAAAEAERMKYLTAGTGKALTYDAKRAEAERFAGDPSPDPADYPFAAAEATVRGITLAAQVALWGANITAWATVLGPAIEAAEQGAKLAVDAAVAAKDAEALAAAEAVTWPSP